MFTITQNKGFWMTFANGYTVSVQWGPSNYCDNRGVRTFSGDCKSKTAEVSVWRELEPPDIDVLGEFVRPPFDWYGDNLCGWCTPEQVAEVIAWAVAQ